MKKTIYSIILIVVMTCLAQSSSAKTVNTKPGNVCKARCRVNEGVICLERGPCEPINEYLLKAAKECRENPTAKYMPVTKLLFVDILSQVIRLDREFPQNIKELTDEDRYRVETKLLAEKGIDIFVGTKALSPLKPGELALVLKDVTLERNLGYSNGLPDQVFDLKNEEFVTYDLELYVDGELWKRKQNFKESLPDSKDYITKLDSCGKLMVLFGDGINAKIPKAGSRIKTLYKYFGRNEKIVTECEIAMLLSDTGVAKALKDEYNPSRPLTKANFVDLLIKTQQLGREFPKDYYKLSDREKYILRTEILARHGIDIFVSSDPDDFLTREELARVLYDCPVEMVVGTSDGMANQSFELNNVGFVIYDLHTFVNEGVSYEEWNKKDDFIESSSVSKDYVVKLDAGNYATIYFGDNRKGRIPATNSPIRVTYRLYAPLTMLTEDDIICVLGKCVPVPEAYEPPPSPPPDFPPPTDGYDDPATHI